MVYIDEGLARQFFAVTNWWGWASFAPRTSRGEFL